MNIELEIVKAICDVIKQGGLYAIYGVVAYMVLQIVKIAIVWGFLCHTVKLVVSLVISFLNNKLNSKLQTFTTFSDKASDKLVERLNILSQNFQSTIESVEKRVGNLENPLEKKAS